MPSKPDAGVKVHVVGGAVPAQAATVPLVATWSTTSSRVSSSPSGSEKSMGMSTGVSTAVARPPDATTGGWLPGTSNGSMKLRKAPTRMLPAYDVQAPSP